MPKDIARILAEEAQAVEDAEARGKQLRDLSEVTVTRGHSHDTRKARQYAMLAATTVDPDDEEPHEVVAERLRRARKAVAAERRAAASSNVSEPGTGEQGGAHGTLNHPTDVAPRHAREGNVDG